VEVALAFGQRVLQKSPSSFSHLVSLKGEKKPRTLIEMTLDRFSSWVPRENRWILTTEGLKGEMEKLALNAQILAEPQGRNTAPCIYWATKKDC